MYDEWGIARGYHDVEGHWHETPPATHEQLRQLLADAPSGDPLWFVEHGVGHQLLGPCHLTLEDGGDLGEVAALASTLPVGYHRLAPLDGGPTESPILRRDSPSLTTSAHSFPRRSHASSA